MKTHSKYCTCISGNYHDSITEVQKADFVEIRLDLCDLTYDERIQVYQKSPEFIATHRGDEKIHKKLLKEAIEHGASYIDIDISRSSNHILEMKRIADDHNCKLILSAHNYIETPSTKSLKNIYESANQFQPDYIKIVTTINESRDNSKILSLYQHYDNLIAFGMGEMGKISRITALHCGAPFTYASSSSLNSTAKGQLTVHSLKRMEVEMLDDCYTKRTQKHHHNDSIQQKAI